MFAWIERNLGALLSLAFIIIIIALCACGNEKAEKVNVLRRDFKVTIVEINGNQQALANDKHHTPTTCNIVLFKVINENNYFTLSSCNYDHQTTLNDAWMYNHRVGDTAYFKYLKLERFFSIKERK